MPHLKHQLTRVGNRFAVRLYAVLDGRLSGGRRGVQVLVITAPGRRTGIQRSTCVRYLDAPGGLVVWGTGSGSPRDPDWFRNLREAAVAHIRVGATRQQVRPRELFGKERDAMWNHVVLTRAPEVARYAQRAHRTIPVAILTPLATSLTRREATPSHRQMSTCNSTGHADERSTRRADNASNRLQVGQPGKGEGMSAAVPTNRVPHLWLKTTLITVGVVVGELGFFISRSAGLRSLEIVSVCVGVVILAAAIWWAVRDGRDLRAAGYKPDFGQLEQRIRRHLKWGVVLAALSVITTALLLAVDRPNDGPLWPIILGPVILIVGLGWLWLVVRFLLPWERRRQQARDGGA
jgi:deazaflavin-dependent oxidoreductase (nitroreductase family)